MIRLLMVVFVAVPVTILYVLRILWSVYREAPDAKCVCERVPRKWAALLLRTAGVRVVLENEEVIDNDVPQILVANHVSWFDVLTLTAFTPGPYVFVAKREVEKTPFFGRAVGACGHIYIDRQDHEKAVASLEAVRKRLEEESPTVIMFPEGTRSATGELQQFKKGAFVLAIQTGSDIIPAAILGSRDVMRKRSLLIHPGTVTVRFGEPIPVKSLVMSQRDQLMLATRDALAGLLASDNESMN